jgi:hypothetical protein
MSQAGRSAAKFLIRDQVRDLKFHSAPLDHQVQREMSALGQKQTLHCSNLMSALPPKADIQPGANSFVQ